MEALRCCGNGCRNHPSASVHRGIGHGVTVKIPTFLEYTAEMFLLFILVVLSLSAPHEGLSFLVSPVDAQVRRVKD
jgi:hypothetical protein